MIVWDGEFQTNSIMDENPLKTIWPTSQTKWRIRFDHAALVFWTHNYWKQMRIVSKNFSFSIWISVILSEKKHSQTLWKRWFSIFFFSFLFFYYGNCSKIARFDLLPVTFSLQLKFQAELSLVSIQLMFRNKPEDQLSGRITLLDVIIRYYFIYLSQYSNKSIEIAVDFWYWIKIKTFNS